MEVITGYCWNMKSQNDNKSKAAEGKRLDSEGNEEGTGREERKTSTTEQLKHGKHLEIKSHDDPTALFILWLA